jgi:hypothetical protein
MRILETSESDRRTFGPEAVCAAADVPRPTLHSWVSRRYLPLSPGPGMGRERQFTILDVVRIGVVSELTRLGISIGVAANAASQVGERELSGRRFALVLVPTAEDSAKAEGVRNVPMGVADFTSFAHVADFVNLRFASPATFAMVDISAVAKRVTSRLPGVAGNLAPPAPAKKRRKASQ